MWTRAELKDRAKFAFKRNYWRSVLISLLLALLIGGGSGAGSAGSAMSSALGSDGSDITSDSYDDFYDDADDIWYEMNDVYDNTDHTALIPSFSSSALRYARSFPMYEMVLLRYSVSSNAARPAASAMIEMFHSGN